MHVWDGVTMIMWDLRLNNPEAQAVAIQVAHTNHLEVQKKAKEDKMVRDVKWYVILLRKWGTTQKIHINEQVKELEENKIISPNTEEDKDNSNTLEPRSLHKHCWNLSNLKASTC